MRPRHVGAPKQRWTSQEESALRAGVEKYGPGKWRAIQKDPSFGPFLSARSNVDLKDKWRNMTVALGIVALGSPSPQERALYPGYTMPRERAVREQRAAAAAARAEVAAAAAAFDEEDDDEVAEEGEDDDDDDDDDDYVEDGIPLAHHSGRQAVGAILVRPRIDRVVVSGHHPWKSGNLGMPISAHPPWNTAHSGNGATPILAHSAPTHYQHAGVSWTMYDNLILEAVRVLGDTHQGCSPDLISALLKERHGMPVELGHIFRDRLEALTAQCKLIKLKSGYRCYDGGPSSNTARVRRTQSECINFSPQAHGFTLPQHIPRGVRKRRSSHVAAAGRRSLPPLSPSCDRHEEDSGVARSLGSAGVEPLPLRSEGLSDHKEGRRPYGTPTDPGNLSASGHFNGRSHGCSSGMPMLQPMGMVLGSSRDLWKMDVTMGQDQSYGADQLSVSAPTASSDAAKLHMARRRGMDGEDAMDVDDGSSSARTRVSGNEYARSSKAASGLLKLALVSSSLIEGAASLGDEAAPARHGWNGTASSGDEAAPARHCWNGAARCRQFEPGYSDLGFATQEAMAAISKEEEEKIGDGGEEELVREEKDEEESYGQGELRAKAEPKEEQEEEDYSSAARCKGFEPLTQEAMFACSLEEDEGESENLKSEVKDEPQDSSLHGWTNVSENAVCGEHHKVWPLGPETFGGAARTSPLGALIGAPRKARVQIPADGFTGVDHINGTSFQRGGTQVSGTGPHMPPLRHQSGSSGMDIDTDNSGQQWCGNQGAFSKDTDQTGTLGYKENQMSCEVETVKPPKKRWSMFVP